MAAQPATRSSNHAALVRIVEQHLDDSYKYITETEDNVRDLGLLYHKTELEARMPASESEEELTLLRMTFETSSVDQHRAAFVQLNTLYTVLKEIGNHIRETNTQARVEAMTQLIPELQISLADLRAWWQKLKAAQWKVGEENQELLMEVGRPGWSTYVQSYSKREEFDIFKTWVSSLPETQKALQVGRELEDIARDMLTQGEEGNL